MEETGPTCDPVPRFVTIPKAAKALGIGVHQLRCMVSEGVVPSYLPDGRWPRVIIDEAVAAIRGTRTPITNHARARVEEILDEERQRAASP